MQLHQQRGRASHVRGRHARALEHGKAVAWDGRQDVHARCADVGLDIEQVGRTAAGEAGEEVLVVRQDLGERCAVRGRACVGSGRAADGAAIVLCEHHGRRGGLVRSPVLPHRGGITRRVVHYQDAEGASVTRVADLGREGADAAVDDDDLPCVRPGRDRRARLGRRTRGRGGGGAVPVRELRGHRRVEGIEVADGRAKGRRSDDYRDPEEVIVRRGAGRDRVSGLAGTLDRVHTGPGVAGGDRNHHSRIGGAVAGDGELVLETVDAAAKAHVDHVHTVVDGVLDRLRDVVRGRVPRLPREHIVVSEERLGGDA